jgi:hypothetical protein
MGDHHTHRFTPVLCVAIAVCFASSPARAQSATGGADRLLLGTWRLDLTKSTYFPGPPVKSETRTYTADKDGVKGVIHRIHADGHVETIEYRADGDQEHAVTGTPAYDAIKLRKLDDRTWESTLSHAGMVFGTARRVISPDGGSMTITFERKTTEDTVRNVAVYHREPQ